MAGAEIATAYLAIVPTMSGVKKAIEEELGKVDAKGAGEKVGSKASSGFASAFKSAGSAVASAMSAAQAAIGGVTGTVTALAATGGINRALAIENAEAKLRGLGNSTEQVSAIMDSAKAAVTGTAYGLGEAASAAGVLAAAGIEAGDGVGQMQHVLSTVASVAAVSGRGFDEVSSIFGKVAANGKLTTESMMQLQDSGIPVLNMLAEHFGVATDAMQEMVTEGEVDFATFNQVMSDNMGAAAEEAGKTFTAAMANARAALSKMGEAVETPVLEALRDVMLQLNPVLNDCASALSGLGDAIAAKLDAPVASVSEKLSALHERLSGTEGSLIELTPGVAAAAAAFAAFSAGGLAPLLSSIPLVGGALGGLAGALGKIGGPLGIAAAALVAFAFSNESVREAFAPLLEKLQAAASSVLPVVTAALDALAAGVQEHVVPAFEWLAPIIGAFLDAIPPLMESLMPLAELLGGLLADALSIAMVGFGGVVEGVTFLMGSLTEFIWFMNGVPDDIKGAIDEVKQGFADMKSRAVERLTELVDAVSGFVESVRSFFARIPVVITSALSDAMDKAVEWGRSLPGQILSAIGDLSSLLFDTGSQLINGFINGAKSMASSLVSAVTGPINDAIGGAKRLLGIASPSKVFRQIGDYTMQGLELGIEGGVSGAVAAMDSAVRDVVGAAAVTVPPSPWAAGTAAAGGSGGAAGGATYNVSVTFDISKLEDLLAHAGSVEELVALVARAKLMYPTRA